MRAGTPQHLPNAAALNPAKCVEVHLWSRTTAFGLVVGLPSDSPVVEDRNRVTRHDHEAFEALSSESGLASLDLSSGG